MNNRPPLTANGIYQMIKRRGVQCGMLVHPHKFRHHFSHTWLYNGGAEGDLMELNGWTSPQMLHRYGASARSTRAAARMTASWTIALVTRGAVVMAPASEAREEVVAAIAATLRGVRRCLSTASS